jgi:membrane protease YdiL (CAAX protease family)
MATWIFSHLLGLTIIAVVWQLGLKRYRVPISYLGLTWPVLPRIRPVLLTAGALLAGLTFNVIYATSMNLINSDFLSPEQDFSDIIFPGLAGIFTFQALAIWTPLTEEIFFRGFVFAGLLHKLGVRWAIVASALIFTTFHITQGTIGVLIPIFVLGLLLAWLYHRTGSLWSSVAAHMGQNSIALMVTIYGG